MAAFLFPSIEVKSQHAREGALPIQNNADATSRRINAYVPTGVTADDAVTSDRKTGAQVG